MTVASQPWNKMLPVLIALVILPYHELYAQAQATPVGVDEVRSEPMSQTIPVLGRFVAPQSGVVAARSPGPVARLRVNVGDHVERGDILVELDMVLVQVTLELLVVVVALMLPERMGDQLDQQ